MAALVDIFEEGRLTEKGVRVLYGDSQSGIQVVLPKRALEIEASQAALESTARSCATGGMETEARGWGGTGSRLPHKTHDCGTTWTRFRTFAGLYNMAEPEDLETLKKIAICMDWALKGLVVAVKSEKWNPSAEEHKTVTEVGICAVAAGHVVQRWKHHLCCLKRKGMAREDEPGNSNGESGNPGSITRWLREDEPSLNPVDGPHVKKGWLRENEPSPQPTSKMPRENEPGINPSNGHHQGPTLFGDSGFGESSFGDSVACSFPCDRLDQVKGPVLSTDFGSSDHRPVRLPGSCATRWSHGCCADCCRSC